VYVWGSLVINQPQHIHSDIGPAAPVVVECTAVLPGHCWCWCCPSPLIDFSPCPGLPSWCLVLYLCVDSPVSAAVLPLGLIITVACTQHMMSCLSSFRLNMHVLCDLLHLPFCWGLSVHHCSRTGCKRTAARLAVTVDSLAGRHA